MSRLDLPDAARELLAAARDVFADAEAYVVGGTVRDALLGLELADLDLAVAGDAPELARALADRLAGHYVLLDAERGTARIVLDDGPIRVIDIARLRGDIATDLSLRDFTIDAIALPFADGADIIDPHGGVRDVAARTVRLVSEQALIDDPLRLLRAVRIATQLDFEIEASTLDALRRHAGRIGQAAAERQRDELARCFSTPHAARAIRLMDGLGLIDQLLPEVAAGRGVTQPKEHYYDVFDHLIETVGALDLMLSEREPPDQRERALRHAFRDGLAFSHALQEHFAQDVSEGRSRASLLKLAGLLHDVAKPETRAADETGRIRFFGHAEVGAETARRVLGRFRYSRRETDLVATMVEEHLRPGQLSQEGLPSRRALYRFFRDTGEAAESVLVLSLADALAARGPNMTLESWRGHVAYVAHVLARRDEDASIAQPPRIVTGEDIMAALGVAPGPEVGRLLAAIEEAQGAGEVTSREAAIELARRLHEGPPSARYRSVARGRAERTFVAIGGAR
ncbi:MAG: HD domain-containing protein [Dehalococcoidia bacterium]